MTNCRKVESVICKWAIPGRRENTSFVTLRENVLGQLIMHFESKHSRHHFIGSPYRTGKLKRLHNRRLHKVT